MKWNTLFQSIHFKLAQFDLSSGDMILRNIPSVRRWIKTVFVYIYELIQWWKENFVWWKKNRVWLKIIDSFHVDYHHVFIFWSGDPQILIKNAFCNVWKRIDRFKEKKKRQRKRKNWIKRMKNRWLICCGSATCTVHTAYIEIHPEYKSCWHFNIIFCVLFVCVCVSFFSSSSFFVGSWVLFAGVSSLEMAEEKRW